MTQQSPALGGQSNQPANSTPRLGGAAALKHIMQALTDDSSGTRRRAVDALAEMGTDEALTILMDALADPNNSVVRRAIRALSTYGWPFTPPPELIDRLMDVWYTLGDEQDTLSIIFGRLADPRALPLLEAPILPEHLWALAQIGWRRDDAATRTEVLYRLVRHAVPHYASMIEALNWPSHEAFITAARTLYATPSQRGDKLAAAEALAHYGDARGADVLLGRFRITIDTPNTYPPEVFARLGDERPLFLLANIVSDGGLRHLTPLQRYLRATTQPLSTEARAELNALIPQVVPVLEHRNQVLHDAALTVLDAATSPEADAVFNAWLASETDALFGGNFDPRRLYHFVKPSVLPRLRNHPRIQAEATDRLLAWLNTHPQEEWANALLCLGYIGEARSLPTLREALHTENDRIKIAALTALGHYPAALDDIIASLPPQQPRPSLRPAIRRALLTIGDADRLAAHIPPAPAWLKAFLADALVALPISATQHHLTALLASPNARVRGLAAFGLHRADNPPRATLRPLLADFTPIGKIPEIFVPFRVCDAAALTLGEPLDR